ncbi:MAG TPA: alpha/beta hydrolase, partial [Bacteroidia bacterium]|nr:alpha/beta hydrolase [Bacteroidia bacterium]
IFLTAHSWGAFIGLLAANRKPELFDAYIGIGQVVNSKESDLLSYNYALKIAQEKKDIKSLKKLEELDPERYNLDADQLTTQRKVLGRVGGRLFKKSISRWIVQCPLFSPEYSYRDLWYMRKTTKQVVQQLYPQMSEHNLFNEVTRVPIPLFILGGWHDYQVGTIIAERFFNEVFSPLKHFYGFDRSGHFPHYEETEKYQQVMQDIKNKVQGFYK